MKALAALAGCVLVGMLGAVLLTWIAVAVAQP